MSKNEKWKKVLEKRDRKNHREHNALKNEK
jgi:hypothetical protein